MQAVSSVQLCHVHSYGRTTLCTLPLYFLAIDFGPIVELSIFGLLIFWSFDVSGFRFLAFWFFGLLYFLPFDSVAFRFAVFWFSAFWLIGLSIFGLLIYTPSVIHEHYVTRRQTPSERYVRNWIKTSSPSTPACEVMTYVKHIICNWDHITGDDVTSVSPEEYA